MNRTIVEPPGFESKSDGSIVGGWWHDQEDRIVCDLCPRACALKPGDRGFCFVRENRDGEMLLTTYGRSTGFCIDPIEKKPLNHFFPGTSVLSFGTAGCNLGCKFCQNWSISKSREVEKLSERATPEMIAQAAINTGCRSVAFTYNDPVIWAEYAIEVGKACRSVGVKTIAVTAAYITKSARKPFFDQIDAANVDLKAFTEQFYQQLTLSHLQPVLDTLIWLKRETDVWFEVTNLVIPQANDSDDEFKKMCDWMLESLGDDVPIHFTAFHPDFKMMDREATPIETLLRAYDLAKQAGMKYAYVGNVHDLEHQSTYCPSCGQCVIQRDWYQLGSYGLNGNQCVGCGEAVSGHFDESPGNWGRKRQPVRISDYADSNHQVADEPTQIELSTHAPVQDHSPPTVQIEPYGESMMSSESNRDDESSVNNATSTDAENTAPPSDTTPNDTAQSDTGRPELTEAQKQAAVKVASEVVLSAVTRQPLQLSDPEIAGAASVPVFGCFVSIKRQGKLRGCCGFLGRRSGLLAAIQESAQTSAIGDVRMPSITFTELPYLDFEIWMLYGQRAVSAKGEDRIKEVQIGKHGLQIQRGPYRGLLLPGVATDHGLDSEGFLRQVCMKAGLPPTAWREENTFLATFEGQVVTGKFVASLLDGVNLPTNLLLEVDEPARLADFCKTNILAAVTGAVPTYYLTGCSDGSVHGVNLEAHVAGREQPLRISQLNSRQTFPLQSSLFQACQAIGEQINREGFRTLHPSQLDVRVGVLYEPAMHGTIENPDLGGIDPNYRAVVVSHGAKSAWLFDPTKTSEQLLEFAAKESKVTQPDRAMINSFLIQASTAPMSVVNVPKPLIGPPVRPPAVAGMFYPAQPDQLKQMVDEMIPVDTVETKRVRAALVPHAGLMFSGKIAADVLRRIEFPETIIVIGPKHTAQGVDWAVAPHDKWLAPGFEISSDRELAQQLSKEIEGLELDALAHQHEHAIEVELPFLHRFAPESKVVGIALSSLNLAQCQRFADGLASVVGDRIDQTLFLISSDMNHFADDTETRRVDEMAMQALDSLEPENVFNTIRDNDISMCGYLPAVIVMQTLKQLGKLEKAERIAYGTSADVSNDKSRVVGYAGMLFS